MRSRVKDRIKAPTEPGPRHYVLSRKGEKIIVDNFNREEYRNSVDFIRLLEPVPPDAVDQTDRPVKAKKTRKALTPEQKAVRAAKARAKRDAKKAAKEAAG